MIKIVILSEIRIYCEGLCRILSGQEAVEVLDAANNITGAAIKIDQLMPDIVLLDMTMPGSCEFAIQIKNTLPRLKIVAIAVPEDEQGIIECAKAGISGYVAREASIQELIETIFRASKGEFCCPPRIAAAVFNKIQNLAQKAKTDDISDSGQHSGSSIQDLTRREQQILDLMTDGLSNKEIANALVIEVSTVKNHVHNILVKLEVHSRTQAVALFQNAKRSWKRGPYPIRRSGEVLS